MLLHVSPAGLQGWLRPRFWSPAHCPQGQTHRIRPLSCIFLASEAAGTPGCAVCGEDSLQVLLTVSENSSESFYTDRLFRSTPRSNKASENLKQKSLGEWFRRHNVVSPYINQLSKCLLIKGLCIQIFNTLLKKSFGFRTIRWKRRGGNGILLKIVGSHAHLVTGE